MTGKTPRNIEVIRPLNNGAISHLDGAGRLIGYLVDRFMKRGLIKPLIAVSVPFDLNHIEKAAVRDACITGGAKEVLTIPDPFSAAVGGGIDILSPRGAAILDVGSGVAEISLLSCGGVVYSHSIRLAGQAMEGEIVKYLSDVHRLRISGRDAERLKLKLSDSKSLDEEVLVNAKNLMTGKLESSRVHVRDIYEAILPSTSKIAALVQRFIGAIPPAFAPSVHDNGLYMTGGSALLGGFAQRIEKEFGLKTVLAKDPLHEIALGAGRIVEDRELFRHFAS
jgi:rod shape-determining protein MreB